MKKYFIMAITAITALTFVGCETGQNTPEPEPGTTAKVTFSQHTLEIAVGAEERVRATLNPVKEGVTITYTSDDAEVATVTKSGIVTGVASGTANIIASATGYESDTCVVTVISAADAFAWGGIILADKGAAISDVYTLFDLYQCRDYEGVYYIYDQNILFTPRVGLSGAGFVAIVHAPVTIIEEGDYAGSYITWELNFDNTYPKDSAGVAAEGFLPESAAEWYSVLSDSLYTGDYDLDALSYLNYWDWDAQTTENDIDFVGFIKNGWIGDYSNGFFYQMNITWFDLEQGAYGLKMEQDAATGKWSFVQPYAYVDTETQYYEVLPERTSDQTEVLAKRLVRVQCLNNEKQSNRYKQSAASFRMAR